MCMHWIGKHQVNSGSRCKCMRPLHIKRHLGSPAYLHRIAWIERDQTVRREDAQRGGTESKHAVEHRKVVAQGGTLKGINDHYTVSPTREASHIQRADVIGMLYVRRCQTVSRRPC